jgi:hypothetical protein
MPTVYFAAEIERLQMGLSLREGGPEAYQGRIHQSSDKRREKQEMKDMPQNELIIYEGAMCCSTGLCGPEPDKELIEFSETIKKLPAEFEGLKVTRAGLAFNPLLFSMNREVLQLVKENGQGILPITTINGQIVARQRYLKYDELRNILAERMKHD